MATVTQFDDLREIVDRSCEAVSKGDSPDAVAAYLWSNISAQAVRRQVQRLRVAGDASPSVSSGEHLYAAADRLSETLEELDS